MPSGDLREPHDQSGSLTHNVPPQRSIWSSRTSPEGTSQTAKEQVDARSPAGSAEANRSLDRSIERSLAHSVGRSANRLTDGWADEASIPGCNLTRDAEGREERMVRNSHPRCSRGERTHVCVREAEYT